MRKKRYKRKEIKTKKKIFIGLIICFALVVLNFSIGHKSEAITFLNETQPIQIMHSLMVVSKTEKLNVDQIARNPYSYTFLSHKILPSIEKKEPVSEESEKLEQNSEQPKPEQQSKPVEQPINQKSTSEEDEKEPATPVNQSTNQKTVYLTFDDGPSAYTSNILEKLSNYNMKATFFMLEPNMRAYPDKLDEILAQGHVPALHGVTHKISKIYHSEQTVVDEMNQAQQTLLNLTGEVTHLIRTPYGSAPYMKPSYKEAVKKAGFQLWDWTVDSEDWKYQNEKYVSRVINQLEHYKYHERPIVILLHDRKTTAEHLPLLLDYLQAHGYETELLNETLTAYHF